MFLSCRCRRILRAPLAMVAACCFGVSAQAADILVDDSGDTLHPTGCAAAGTGPCTLRDAITFANANPGPHAIRMTGVVVRPTSPLPPITTNGTTVDGTHHPLLSPGPGVIDGTLAGASDGLVLAANGCTLLGITVQNFEGTGLLIRGSNSVIGNFVPPPCMLGCPIQDVVVSGNKTQGIEIRGGANNRLVYFTSTLNGGYGVYVHDGATGNRIGYPAAASFGKGGVVGGNRLASVGIGQGSGDSTTSGNTVDLGNLYGSVGGQSIDLGGDGPTSNDALDADTGPNGFQNFPIVTSAVTEAGNAATVTGTFQGAPNASFTLRFYRADSGSNPFVDEATVNTDTAGNGTFSALVHFPFYATPPPAGVAIPLVATATDAAGSTSELSGPVLSTPPTRMAFHTLPPCRQIDTRVAPAAAGDLQGGPALLDARPRLFLGTDYCDVPATARALVSNVTVTNATNSGHVVLAADPWPADTSTINFQAGQTRANSVIVPLDPFGRLAVHAFVAGSGTVDVILDVSGYFDEGP